MLSDSVIAGNIEIMLAAWRSFKPLFATFISTTEINPSQSEEHIVSSVDGYYEELLRCGISHADMGGDDLLANPYSTRMRPLTDITEFAVFAEVFMTKASYYALDVTLTGDSEQDAAIITKIEESLLTSNDAYNQSRFRLSELGGWQPNFFCPYFAVREKGEDIFKSLAASNFGTKTNRGDRSIRKKLPCEYNAPLPVPLGKIPKDKNAFDVKAGAGQIIELSPGVRKIQRYPLIAEFEFIGLKA